MNAIRKVIFSTLLLLSAAVQAQQYLKISVQKPPETPAFNYLTSLYKTLSHRIGIEFVFHEYPHKRSSQMLADGLLDGDISRVYEYKQWYPELVRVEEPHYTGYVIAVARFSNVTAWSFDDIVANKVNICFHRGSLIVENRLHERVDRALTHPVSSLKRGLRTLLAGRCEVLIGVSNQLRNLVHDTAFSNASLHIIDNLYSYSGHMYLAPQHKLLAERISNELRLMRKEGIIDKLLDESGLEL
ncbi:hypothetical protein [Vibrio sp. SCSIO 43137]|uniref:hypothetical protein n=1 Tax=Vibrio sp. SCSIO 43137 TaxID=3021011 RepID=UPI00230707F0|nr:hypothetical protein [Vibrio sp. SCSIO 43137]WCE30806.1 hypothetical protein PK654_05915 [Vibrio sp. SCSIO 43137]